MPILEWSMMFGWRTDDESANRAIQRGARGSGVKCERIERGVSNSRGVPSSETGSTGWPVCPVLRVEIALMRTPDGHSRLELSRFLAPPVVADHRTSPVNALGNLRVMFAVEDLDETLARLRNGAHVVGRLSITRTRTGCATSAAMRTFSGLAQQLAEHASRGSLRQQQA